MEDKRRYEPGFHPVYDRYFTRMRAESAILNPSATVDIHTVLADKVNVTSLLSELKGNAEGMYYRPGERAQMAQLSAIERDLVELEEAYKRASQMQVNSGRPPLQDWPSDLLEKKLRLQAQYDTTLEEIAKLEKMLSSFIDKEDLERDLLMLKQGPAGTGRLRHGFLVELDYQQVVPDEQGILRIKDNRSPYDGWMTAEYYSRISKPFQRAKAQITKEKFKLAQEIGIPNQNSEAFRSAWEQRYTELVKTRFPEWSWLFTRQLPGKQLMPNPTVVLEKMEEEKNISYGKQRKPKAKVSVGKKNNG